MLVNYHTLQSSVNINKELTRDFAIFASNRLLSSSFYFEEKDKEPGPTRWSCDIKVCCFEVLLTITDDVCCGKV